MFREAMIMIISFILLVSDNRKCIQTVPLIYYKKTKSVLNWRKIKVRICLEHLYLDLFLS